MNPMQMSGSRFEWKETQTEVDMLLGDEKSRYDGSREESAKQQLEFEADMARRRADLEARHQQMEVDRARAVAELEEARRVQKAADLEKLASQKAELEADLARQREEITLERNRLEDERKRAEMEASQQQLEIERLRAIADSEEARRVQDAGDLEKLASQKAEFEEDLARQREEFTLERNRLEDERKRVALELEEAEQKRLEAERAAEEAELKRREASAGMLFQKALSRQSLTTAQQKKEEAEAAEHHAEEMLREAEHRRHEAEELEHKHREELAAMKAMKEELDNSMTEPLEFVKNKAELSPAGLDACTKILPVLLRNPELPICIDGHTNCFLDKCKDHCTHVHLSQKRVDAVKEQLRQGGAHNNILTKGWGCKHPELKNVRAVRIYPAPKDLVKVSKMTHL
jgi:outer membrane protein OmpA-like peptidoglycan-associated protein